MKILYLDCTCGISGDMLLSALSQLGANILTDPLYNVHEHCHEHSDENHEEHHHGRSYTDVLHIIEHSSADSEAKRHAAAIYGVIARAESKVHCTSLNETHFHEVGRDEAVSNAIRVGQAIVQLGVDRIICSDIYDGHGFIECSHGRIPVPVPAVVAMKSECNYAFFTADVDTEMVTPSGLAMLIGLGAEHSVEMPIGEIIASGVGKGRRDTGMTGLMAKLIEV